MIIPFQRSRPTIVAGKSEKWDHKTNAAKLDKAIDGVGTDEKAIIDVLCRCNSQQRTDLKKAFKMQTQEDLLLVIREELSGEFLELILVMLRDPLAFDVDLLNILLKVCV